MKQYLIELNTKDNLLLNGILFTPNKRSNKTVIHVHGLSDNFYGKKFIKTLAKMYTNNNYNYISFNNRGSGYSSKISKEDSKINAGSYCELFKESFFDIDAAIDYAIRIKSEEIILEGHSLGCSKIVNYLKEVNNPIVKKVILLAPCDGIKKINQIMKNNYEEILALAKEELKKGNLKKVLFSEEMFPQTYTVETFVTDYVENSSLDIFRYRDKDYKSDILARISIPILIIVGDKDQMAFISENDDITPFFKNNLNTKYTLKFIMGANHNYENYEDKLSKIIKEWINKEVM